MSIRNAAVAGAFYPADKQELQDQLNKLLADELLSATKTNKTSLPKALILPHAGYIYSAEVAAVGYRLLNDYKTSINKVVLLGPSHRLAFEGVALPESDYFATPLGFITVDPTAWQQLQSLPFVFQSEQAHLYEHSLEVQLPFLQVLLKQFSIVPLVVGDATPEQVAKIIEFYLGEEGVLIIISTDLSHFHDYQQAQIMDKKTSLLIIDKNHHLQGEQACGCRPLNGLLKLAGQQNLSVQQLALCNSGDTAGDKKRVVGYGAFVVN